MSTPTGARVRRFVRVSELRRGHGEAGVHLGVDGLPLGFEVEGRGAGVVGSAEGHGAHHAAGGGHGDGGGVLGAEVGEFDEGGEVGAEGLGVFAGALDGFEYGLAAGFAVGG